MSAPAPTESMANSLTSSLALVSANLTSSPVSSHLISSDAGQTLDETSAQEVRALNSLIVSVLDNVDEYRRAIFALEQRLDTLQRGVYHRMQAVEQLQSRVRALGGQPATTRSTLAAAFASLLALRPFAKDHEQHLLQDIERGEQALKREFKTCLAGSRLSDTGRHCVSEAFDRIGTERSKTTDSWNAQCALVATTALQSSPLPSS